MYLTFTSKQIKGLRTTFTFYFQVSLTILWRFLMIKILIEKGKNNIFHRLLFLNFGSKLLARHTQHLLCAAHIASDFTCVYCTAAGTIFGTTDVYELGFSYLSISIFIGRELHFVCQGTLIYFFSSKILTALLVFKSRLQIIHHFFFWPKNSINCQVVLFTLTTINVYHICLEG